MKGIQKSLWITVNTNNDILRKVHTPIRTYQTHKANMSQSSFRSEVLGKKLLHLFSSCNC